MPTPLPEEKTAALTDLIFSGQKIAAIKLYRELTGHGLKEAKDEVEAIESRLRREAPDKFTAPPKTGGCTGTAAIFLLCAAALGYWTLKG